MHRDINNNIGALQHAVERLLVRMQKLETKVKNMESEIQDLNDEISEDAEMQAEAFYSDWKHENDSRD